ncbi:c-type cytochrome [Gayadomonas joobiniege]|uniref:c-type cytochrome n=1 Tax=Gayadomonas joobiniege TaxID=1234606 RepID=UPI0003619F48|nr:c-type cytochrome [Gayadomonas joobiniege]
MKQATFAIWPLLCMFSVLPFMSSAETNKPNERVNIVAQGKTLFVDKGCVECHANKKGDTSYKTGPNLWGLFQKTPKMHSIYLSNGRLARVEADQEYLKNSLLIPATQLAIQELGPERGSPYLAVMPKIFLNGHERNALFAYLKTLNEKRYRGPQEVWRSISNTNTKQKQRYDNELWAGKDATFSRHHIADVSTRSIHIALPNKTNYSFDSKDFSVKRIWSGGFLDITPERTNRGRGLNELPSTAKEWKDLVHLLPLTSDGKPVDLGFKNWPTFKTEGLLEQYRIKNENSNFAQPYLDQVNAAKGQFLGIDHQNKKAPILMYKIEGVTYRQAVTLSLDGHIQFAFALDNSQKPVRFKLDNIKERLIEVSHGTVNEDIWTVPVEQQTAFSIRFKLDAPQLSENAANNLHEVTHDKQPVKMVQDDEAKLPAGYQAFNIMAPLDKFGREQLFEPLAIDFAVNGDAVIASRTSGIWKIKDKYWHFFADGFYDPLGVYIEDEAGDQMVIAHKPELTRLTDVDGDGYADTHYTINDDWRYAGNYCEYVHGPVPDGQGGYFLNLNLAHGGDKVHGGPMGTFGGYDGWLVKIDKNGVFTPWASGLRSPAGLGYGSNKQLLYTDNQGVFVGTSKMHLVKKDAYYGYPASLKDHPDHRGKSINWQQVNKKARLAEIYFPHGIVGNSPGNPTFDSTKGGFGPFAGQILVGDQSLSNISRVVLEEVNHQWQGVVIPFISGLQSGAMRLTFAPDNSLWVGQTGRGWSARGGHYQALQKIVWDGKTQPFEIKNVQLTLSGFKLTFSDSLQSNKIAQADISVKSWRYLDTNVYGSPRYDLETHQVTDLSQADKSIKFNIKNMRAGFIYEIKLADIRASAGTELGHNSAYYTLHQLKP